MKLEAAISYTQHHIGSLVIFAGLALVIIGLIIWFGGFSWFGSLPGDISIKRENMRIYIPLTSMLLLSLLLTLALNLLKRLFR